VGEKKSQLAWPLLATIYALMDRQDAPPLGYFPLLQPSLTPRLELGARPETGAEVSVQIRALLSLTRWNGAGKKGRCLWVDGTYCGALKIKFQLPSFAYRGKRGPYLRCQTV
jgi:hypothetical protein